MPGGPSPGWTFSTPLTWPPGTRGRKAPLEIQEIPAAFRNKNAEIFDAGFKNLNFQNAPLRRGPVQLPAGGGQLLHRMPQRLPPGLQAEQPPETVLKTALDNGLVLVPEMEVDQDCRPPWGLCC